MNRKNSILNFKQRFRSCPNGSPSKKRRHDNGKPYTQNSQLSKDGDKVAVFKYGKSYDDSAFYKSQVSASFLFYDPHFFGTINNDVWGVSLNWIDAVTAGARPESGVEIFYRFPLYPTLDMSINYQGIINPALDPDNDFASAFSLRFVTTF